MIIEFFKHLYFFLHPLEETKKEILIFQVKKDLECFTLILDNLCNFEFENSRMENS